MARFRLVKSPTKGLNVLKIPFHAITPIRTLQALGLDKGQEILVDLVF